MDKITLFNQSLHKLGDREYYRDTPSGKECDLWFPVVLHEALMFGAWSFASKEVMLHPASDNEFVLPVDCVRVLYVGAPLYRILERRIKITPVGYFPPHEGRLPVRYLSNDMAKEERLPEQEPLFCRGVMLLLAARIAPKLTSEAQLAMVLEAEATNVLRDALHRDAIQQCSNDQHPLRDILNNSIF